MTKSSEDVGVKQLNDPKAFIEYSQCVDGVYGNIDDYNPNRHGKILIAFNDMIADIMNNKKFQAIYYMQEIKYISCIHHTILTLHIT